jgi:hypothetical protein
MANQEVLSIESTSPVLPVLESLAAAWTESELSYRAAVAELIGGGPIDAGQVVALAQRTGRTFSDVAADLQRGDDKADWRKPLPAVLPHYRFCGPVTPTVEQEWADPDLLLARVHRVLSEAVTIGNDSVPITDTQRRQHAFDALQAEVATEAEWLKNHPTWAGASAGDLQEFAARQFRHQRASRQLEVYRHKIREALAGVAELPRLLRRLAEISPQRDRPLPQRDWEHNGRLHPASQRGVEEFVKQFATIVNPPAGPVEPEGPTVAQRLRAQAALSAKRSAELAGTTAGAA